MKRSKLYRARLASVDRQSRYALPEAVKLLKGMPVPKFDETVEIAFRLGIDPRQSDQVVRGAIVLPKGTGKKVRVAVVAEGEAAQKARDAGADVVGFDDLLERIKGGWLEFDVLIATPDAMRVVRTLGRLLGPRGLMPNPKTGTVTDNTGTAVQEAKGGRVEYRCDRAGCVHMPIGKVSFTPEDLVENAEVATHTVLRARPATAKGTYVLSATLCATMSPGIRLDLKDMVKA
jgi:large subunit ribosomal protein L1